MPRLPIGMASFVTLVRRAEKNQKNPIVVHCSAGTDNLGFKKVVVVFVVVVVVFVVVVVVVVVVVAVLVV